MAEHPIIFSGPMVRALLAGSKTQTRRVIKPQPPRPGDYRFSPAPDKAIFRRDCNKWWLVPQDIEDHDPSPATLYEYACPYGGPGDLLWCRETWQDVDIRNGLLTLYRADSSAVSVVASYEAEGGHFTWSPSIFMPRMRSRITLRIESVRVERLLDITEADAQAEGFGSRAEFLAYWDTLNAGRGFPSESNPWVWCVTFRRETHE
jgi:hypothetical protein